MSSINTSKARLFDNTFCFLEQGEGVLQAGLRTGRRAAAGRNLIIGEKRWSLFGSGKSPSTCKALMVTVCLPEKRLQCCWPLCCVSSLLYVHVLIWWGRSNTRLITWLTWIQTCNFLWCKNHAVFWCRSPDCFATHSSSTLSHLPVWGICCCVASSSSEQSLNPFASRSFLLRPLTLLVSWTHVTSCPKQNWYYGLIIFTHRWVFKRINK